MSELTDVQALARVTQVCESQQSVMDRVSKGVFRYREEAKGCSPVPRPPCHRSPVGLHAPPAGARARPPRQGGLNGPSCGGGCGDGGGDGGGGGGGGGSSKSSSERSVRRGSWGAGKGGAEAKNPRLDYEQDRRLRNFSLPVWLWLVLRKDWPWTRVQLDF